MKNVSLQILICLSFIGIINCQSGSELTPQGVLFPRYTTAQRNALSAVQGQVIFNNSTNKLNVYDGSAWQDYTGPTPWSQNASDISYNSGDVGIGVTNPNASLEINQNGTLNDPHVLLHEDGNDYARLNFDNNNGSNYWSIAAYIASIPRNDRINFWNGTNGDVMTLTGDGQLGIGVGISPKTELHVGNNMRVLFGTDTLGNGDKLMFLPDLHAFRVGTVAAGAASTYWNRDSIGLYSFASGYNTRAQGFGGTAMGRDTEAVGSYAFASGYFTNADGLYSTAMGFNTDALATGSVAIGYSTDATGSYSNAFGYITRAQSYATTAIGRYNVGGGSPTSWVGTDPVFEIGIGNSGSSRENAVTVLKNGNVGIGVPNPLTALHVNGRIRFNGLEYLEDGGANEIAARGDLRPTANNIYDLGTTSQRWDDVYATNGTINTSDQRDKKNIKDIPYGLSEILELNPVIYQWKENKDPGYKLGLIAQELLGVLPEVVKTYDYKVDEEDESVFTKVEADRLGVYYSDIIPVLVKGMQDQQSLINEMKVQIENLSSQVEDLKKK